ncbi:glycosyltransferase family 8 protein [Hymenobacter seoulensis]
MKNIKSDNGVVNIAAAFDQNYIVPFYALVSSINKHNYNNYINMHCFATGLSQDQRDDLILFANELSMKLLFHDIDESSTDEFILPEDTHFTKATYYRLFFPEVLAKQGVDKFIYLDIDIIVNGDLRELYETDLGDYSLGAVPDSLTVFNGARIDLGIYKSEDYFNAGVLFVNVNKWIEQRVTERAIEYSIKYPERIIVADQDCLNGVLVGNWKKLDNKFNLIPKDFGEYHMSLKEIKHAINGAIVIHFAGGSNSQYSSKPWSVLCKSRLQYLYFDALKNVPKKYNNKYLDKIILSKNFKSYMKIKISHLYFSHPVFAVVWKKIKKLK